MSELTPEGARTLFGTLRVELDDGMYVFVRTLTGADLSIIANLGENHFEKLFALLLSDENGSPKPNGTLNEYPLWIIKKVVEQGMAFNRLTDELDDRKKN